MRPLGTAVRGLLTEAATAYAGRPEHASITAMTRRLDEPLRVAIAGRVKAGKSTLLNALVGERLAATDAGECTTVLTWYVGGLAARAWAHPRRGAPRQLPFERVDGRTALGLGPFRPAELQRVVVEVPSSRLDRLTLIDTPGIGSVNEEVSRRTVDALGAAADRPPEADAVLYLMRHLHGSDVGFLDAFRDPQFSGVSPVNAIGVLSRADEVGAGRTDALDVAHRVAAGYRREARVRGLVQTVVPVAGLLAEAGVALRERDHAALTAVAAAGADGDALLLSADRFTADDAETPVLAPVRRELLGLMALSGVRLAVTLIRAGAATDSTGLARELVRRSGLDELRAMLLAQFTDRSDLLKAQHTLSALDRILIAHPVQDAKRLRARLEAVRTGAHALTELRLLNDLRTGAVRLSGEDARDDAEALLGVVSTDVRSRLRLPPDTPVEELRPALIAALRRWQRHAAHPTASAALRRVADVLRRSCEGHLAALSADLPVGR